MRRPGLLQVYGVIKSWTWLGDSTTTVTRTVDIRKANGKHLSREMKVIYFK